MLSSNYIWEGYTKDIILLSAILLISFELYSSRKIIRSLFWEKPPKKIKKNKLKAKEKDLNEKINMFNRLPDECLVCDAKFDKNNKEMVQDWYVVVRNETKTVKLYCPECWNRAKDLIEQIKTHGEL